MPRDFLTSAQRAELLSLPTEERDLIRFYTLSPPDKALIRRRRGEPNRLGFAVQLSLLRHPGRAWDPEEVLPEQMVAYIAGQAEADPRALVEYATRDNTRKEHYQELLDVLGFRTFDGHDYRELRGWLVEPARAVDRGAALVAALFEELRRRRIVAPRISVLERLARESRRQARSELHRSLVCDLDDAQREQLEGLLEVKQSRRTVLGWLREPSGVASVTNLLKHLERLRFARALGIPAEWTERTHPNRLRQLAREGLRVSVSHLRQYEPDRRLATLVAVVLEGMASLTDEILEMHERVLGGFFKKAERLHLERFETNARAINEKVVLYSRVGQALIEARAVASDPFAAIDAAVGWERFIKSVEEANALARSEDFDWLDGISRHYSQLRRYAPELLETFTFEPTPACEDVVKAVEILKALNAKDQRELPDDVPTSFVRRRWEPHVFKEGGIDRRFYELCTMSEVTNALRSGDLAVKGSRQFRDFEAYLLPKPLFEELQQKAGLTLPIDTDFPRYFDARAAQLQDELARVELMAQHGALPDAEIADGRLRISPLSASGDDETDRWSERLYGLLRRVRITDLLTEVDRWTSFTQHFTHLRSGEPAKDNRLLLTAVLADAINLGPTRMTQACPGTSLAKLLQVGDWHVRDETYAKALAEIVNHHHQMPLALQWGQGTTSSSDAQRFPAGAQGEATGLVNARYGSRPSVLFYTHVSDQYAPFYTKVINATVRDATHVLDGLLYHETDLSIEEHYTDTAGFTDHVFALCHLLGFRFAPRIRDLADKRFYIVGSPSQYPTLSGLIGGRISRPLMERHWQEILRLATSIRQGTVTASLILRKLGSYPRQNALATALREVGRLERTLFGLHWLRDLELRHRVQAGLNKGESRNSLARAIYFNRLGEVRERSFEDQRYRASGLNLVVAAITLWNTVYLERAIAALRDHGIDVLAYVPAKLSPLGWSHINLTGDYYWRPEGGVRPGRLRPLRSLPDPLAA